MGVRFACFSDAETERARITIASIDRVFNSSSVLIYLTRTREQSTGLATAGATRPPCKGASTRQDKQRERGNEREGMRVSEKRVSRRNKRLRRVTCVLEQMFYSKIISIYFLSICYLSLLASRLILASCKPQRGPCGTHGCKTGRLRDTRIQVTRRGTRSLRLLPLVSTVVPSLASS